MNSEPYRESSKWRLSRIPIPIQETGSKNDANSLAAKGPDVSEQSARPLAYSKPGSVLVVRWCEPWIVFGISFLLYALLGWAGAYFVQTYNWDGVSRIAQAHGVLFSRDPHLAALGFIWPPLPALTDLPFLLALKPLGLVLLAGPIMSALYAAFALAMLSDILRRFSLPVGWRVIWIVAFGAHKLIVHNSVMGLSEAPFLAFLLLSLNGFMMWERDRRPSGLLWAGVGAAIAVYCRYEALAWAAVVVVAIVWQLLFDTRRLWSSKASGSVIAFITPPVWALVLWVFANWQITGNPIYFLVGPGSTATTPDTAHVVGPTHPFYYAQDSIVGSILLVLREILDLAPLVLPASILLVGLTIWRRRWPDMAYLALAWSIVAFTFLIAFRGLLPPWTRYFFWILPAGVVTAGAAFRASPVGWPRHTVAGATSLLMLFPTIWLPLQAWPQIQQPTPQRLISAVILAPEAAYAALGGQLDEFVDMATYLNSQPPGKLTMIDASVGSGIVFYLDRPDQLVITTDQDFFPVLASPVGKVSQVLVPRPTLDTKGRSEIVKLYPGLYDGGEPWARLIHEFPGEGGWRLFQVVKP